MIVPFEEDEKDPRTWFLDHNYIESMNDMFKKVNGKLPPPLHSLPQTRTDLERVSFSKRKVDRLVSHWT